MPPAQQSFTWEVSGWNRLMLLLSRSRRQSAMIAAQALYQEALVIFGRSQRYTPVRFGVLRASGHVKPPVIVNDGAEIMIGYGGAAAPYAWFVHEREVNRATGRPIHHTSPTRAKFLTTAVREAGQTLEQRLSRRMRGLFEQGYGNDIGGGVF